MTPANADPERVARIAEALRSEVLHRAPEQASGGQPDPLAAVRERQWIDSHLPIGWPTMPKGIVAKLVAYAQKVVRRLLRWYIDPLVAQQNRYNAAVSEALTWLAQRETLSATQLQEQISANYQHIQHHEDSIAEAHGAIIDLETEHGPLAQTQVALMHAVELARQRIQRLENQRIQAQPPSPRPPQDAPTAPAASQPAFDYYLLGIAYRSDEQIAERLGDYDDLLSDLATRQRDGTLPDLPVLDVGCGRGDLIGHLHDLGLSAYGIEIDADAAGTAQAAGYDVRVEDVHSHLAALPDAGLAAITLIQVVEHLDVDALLRLYRLCADKLAPGGFVLAETINPHCLEAVTRYYLLDPSHKSLLPPQLTQMLMEQCGLGRCRVRYLRPVPEPTRLEPVQLADPSAPALVRNIERLNDILYGPQDYAVIGYRPEV